jgi:hypothetical protein
VGYAAATILEFELRQLRNELRSVARSRLRLVMWIVSAIGFVVFISARFYAAHITHRHAPHVVGPTAAIYAGVYVGYFGLALTSTMAIGAQFASTAEALFAGASRIGPRAIFIWLQLRALRRTLVRTFVFLIILVTTGNADALETARLTVFGLACILVPPAFAFHISILPPRAQTIVRIVGVVLIAVAVGVGFEIVPGGVPFVRVIAQGAWWPFALVLGVAAFGVCFSPVADPVPELLAATRPGGLLAQRLVERRARIKRDGGRTSDWLFDVNGEWVILSGKLATFFRQRTPAMFALGLVGWFAAGLAIGSLGLFFGPSIDEMVLASSIPFFLIMCLLVASVGRDLGTEIRNPLWWTGDAAMFSRLGVDAIASLWRFIITGAAVIAGYGAFFHGPTATMLFALYVALIVLARCCGYMLFAYFPAAIDQRGALAGLRIIILFALAIPVGAVGIAVTIFGFPPFVQVVSVVTVSLVEAVGLLWFAAQRIDGRLEAFLTAA